MKLWLTHLTTALITQKYNIYYIVGQHFMIWFQNCMFYDNKYYPSIYVLVHYRTSLQHGDRNLYNTATFLAFSFGGPACISYNFYFHFNYIYYLH